MMGILDRVAREQRANAADRARCAAIQREIEAIGQPECSGNFEAIVAADTRLRDLRRQLEIAEGVEQASANRATEALAAQAEKAADADHAAEERRAQADMKLVREVGELSEKLAAKLTALEASRKRTEAANEARGNRPGIVDAELRVRSRPGALRPAITETRTVWVDVDDNVVKAEIYDTSRLKYVKNPQAVRQVQRNFVLQEEQQEPPRMPERLASAIRLVSLEGRQLWPPPRPQLGPAYSG